MSTMERDWGIEPDIDPEPLPKYTRRLPAHNPDGWQGAQDQYEAHLDRMGES